MLVYERQMVRVERQTSYLFVLFDLYFTILIFPIVTVVWNLGQKPQLPKDLAWPPVLIYQLRRCVVVKNRERTFIQYGSVR
jgi:hypothetical protein